MNNKGFAIAGFLYSIFLLAIIFFLLIFLLIGNNSTNLFKLQNKIREDLNDFGYNNTNNYAYFIYEDENPIIELGSNFNFLEGVKLIKYDGLELNNEITYTVSPTFNNEVSGKYVITYQVIVEDQIITKKRILTVLDKPSLYTYLNNLVPNNGSITSFNNGRVVNLGEYGIRYQGNDPDNYVYFNCSDYNNPTSTTCELWRIIGIVDGKIKIIRNESIGEKTWDCVDNNGDGDCYDEGESYNNNWSDATLKTYLNGEYLTSLTTKNSVTGNMISPSTWYLRGHDTSEVTKDVMYNLERTNGTVLYETPFIENTKIGLMYPSDWGYAAMETDSCLSTTILYDYEPCKPTNWIVHDSGFEWTITPYSYGSSDAFYVVSDGYVNSGDYYGVYDSRGVRPVLHLTSEIAIGGGSGLKSDPYQLSVE